MNPYKMKDIFVETKYDYNEVKCNININPVFGRHIILL